MGPDPNHLEEDGQIRKMMYSMSSGCSLCMSCDWRIFFATKQCVGVSDLEAMINVPNLVNCLKEDTKNKETKKCLNK